MIELRCQRCDKPFLRRPCEASVARFCSYACMNEARRSRVSHVCCPAWRTSFEAFLADMGPRPEGMTIERENVDGNYEPANCRWATNAEQGSNLRRSILITYQGKTMCAPAWGRELGMSRETIRKRFKKGWPLERVFAKGDAS